MVDVDGDVVVLDVEADSYQCLLDAGTLLSFSDDGKVLAESDEVAQQLIDAGLCTAKLPPRRRKSITPARRDVRDFQRVSLAEALSAGVSLVRSTVAFKRRGMSGLIAFDRPLPSTAAAPRQSQILTTASAAAAVLPWIPFERECLLRGFQLQRLFRERGVDVSWVFGVKTWPFAAHCWVQVGDLVVGDTVDRVSRYTPIMAV